MKLLKSIGKGPGFMVLAFLEAAIGTYLLKAGIDGLAIAAVFGAINVPVFGGGAWKASAEARNGSKNATRSS